MFERFLKKPISEICWSTYFHFIQYAQLMDSWIRNIRNQNNIPDKREVYHEKENDGTNKELDYKH